MICNAQPLLADHRATPRELTTNASRAGERTLSFPETKSIGSLSLLHRNPSCPHKLISAISGEHFGAAVGKVKVAVPPNSFLVLDTNKRIFEDPSLLDNVQPAGINGIDGIKMGFISLADNEDNMFEKASAHLNRFKGLQLLNVDRSDATDAALSRLNNLPNLRMITCWQTQVHGKCLKDLAKLPALQELSLSWTDLAPESLSYLANMPELAVLNLEKTHLNQRGARYLAKCQNLYDLDLRTNPEFDDTCLQYLVGMNKLRLLRINRTAVTIEGLRKLSGLHLENLTVSNSLMKHSDELKKIFPHTGIYGEGTEYKLTRADKRLFAPLK